MEQLRQQFPADDFSLLAIVLLFPLVGAFVCGAFGKRLGKEGVRLMALSAVGGAFLASVVTFVIVASAAGAHAAGGLAHGGAAGASPASAAPAVRFVWNVWRWFSIDGQLAKVPIDVAFSVDPLSAVMMLVVTCVGFLIHLYSSAYMKDDPGFYRYFSYLNLFVFSMLVLILGDNLAVLFVGWEGVGLCSYLLIGFWFTDETKAAAGKKAFITNRIGDFGLLVAMAMLVYYAGTLRFSELETGAQGLLQTRTLWPLSGMPPWLESATSFICQPLGIAVPIRANIATLVAIALFVGCIGKSAQLPLFVWLPDAMAGPTPVSALIHAATMVTAGVYLIARTSFIFALSPAAMALVALTGALTALFAASIAFAQNDLKKVLAYSTVSQLGYMFIGVGTGAFAAGFFHVITHAFFKGCLFLCAGSVIHAMHARIHDESGSQDMRNMGGLKKHLPITHATYLISCLAIAGCPPLSGFWSKDEVLFKALTNRVQGGPPQWVAPAWFGTVIYALGLATALGTAFYMFRSYFLTFSGEFRGWRIATDAAHAHAASTDATHDHAHTAATHDHAHTAAAHDHAASTDAAHTEPAHTHDHAAHAPAKPLVGPAPHESPWQMTLPLVVLAFLALVSGLLYAEPLHIAPLEHFWQPVFATAQAHIVAGSNALVWPLLGVGAAAFALGTGAAYYVYVLKNGAPAAAFVGLMPRLHRLVYDKWRIDELYRATVIGFCDSLGETAASMDKWLIDGVSARFTGVVIQVAGALLRLFQTGRVQVYAAAMVLGTASVGWFLLTPHAAATVDTTKLRTTGEAVFEAAPGRGYTYRFSDAAEPRLARFSDAAEPALPLPSDAAEPPRPAADAAAAAAPPSDAAAAAAARASAFGTQRSYSLKLAACETKSVRLEVKNLFGNVAETTFTQCRELRRGCCKPVGSAPDAPAPTPKKSAALDRGAAP
ncbi:MAG: NADH-quinone oxidoreductase subunit L [Myxococcales bacterium]|nr:NADH-quinone oxidoreductase subunit L [Myxococcales bacterium]